MPHNKSSLKACHIHRNSVKAVTTLIYPSVSQYIMIIQTLVVGQVTIKRLISLILKSNVRIKAAEVDIM